MFDAQSFLKTLTTRPGVYRMLDADGRVLYVGKARNLRQRLVSYFHSRFASPKTRRLVAYIHTIEVTVTRTEAEALLLESLLIKELQPRYNILLRDDKGYPYIHVSEEDFPRLSLQRQAKRGLPGRYFGPYPNVAAVRDALELLQKIFRLRSCEMAVFRGRTRPCLQYQIRRCTAPCVGLIDRESYQQQVHNALQFLEGRSSQLIESLTQRMEQFAAELRFEEAAWCRDQIGELRQIQQRQCIETAGGDWDVVACAVREGIACVQVLVFREGRLLGHRAFFPTLPEEAAEETVIQAFLGQYYVHHPIPEQIVLSHAPLDKKLLVKALQAQAGHQVTISVRPRGPRAHELEMAQHNAQHALEVQCAGKAGMQRRLAALRDVLKCTRDITRLECFDVSHTQGEAPVVSCVVFDTAGPRKTDYRRYFVDGIPPGDDCAALRQALRRRYTRLLEEHGSLPDVLFVDGGKGQVTQVETVLAELAVTGIFIVGIAKGPERKPGLETLYIGTERPVNLATDSAALHLVQHLRDEAHRFALFSHRRRRAKTRTRSILEEIAGIGPRRRQALLRQFGGLKQLTRAGIDDLVQVPGINRALAQRIYNAFHGEY